MLLRSPLPPVNSRNRPNVIVIVFDTARADAFEPYGAPAGSSPVMADMATLGQSAATFATASWTVPSHISLFSGLLPYAARVTHDHGFVAANFRAMNLALRDRTLPEVLRTYGYVTSAVSCNTWVSQASGFDVGFDVFRQVVGSRYAQAGGGRLRNGAARALQALRAQVDDGAGEVERLLVDWLRTRGHAPFFWFVNLVECHSPYMPPHPHNPLPPWGRLLATVDASRHLTFAALAMSSLKRTGAPAAALARMRKLYAGAIRLMDDWLGRLLESLDRAGILDETVVIVTSDHGENFGEGGLMGHQYSLDDRLIRVPLVVTGPGMALPDRIMTLAELPGLIAGAAGLGAHPWTHERPDPDIVVAELEPPAGPDHEISRAVAREHGLDATAFERMTTPLRCATDGRFKLVRQGDREMLVDVVADPLELTPLASDAQPPDALLSRLRAALDRSEANTLPAPPPQAAELAPEAVANMDAQLRLLGYI
jgi:arylsulfatase A-like enzyme